MTNNYGLYGYSLMGAAGKLSCWPEDKIVIDLEHQILEKSGSGLLYWFARALRVIGIWLG